MAKADDVLRLVAKKLPFIEVRNEKFRRHHQLPLLACAVQRRRFTSGCETHPAKSLRPEAIGAVMEVTKWLEPSM